MTEHLALTSEAAKALGVSARALNLWKSAGLIEAEFTTPGGHARWSIPKLSAKLKIPIRTPPRDEEGNHDQGSGP